MRNLKGQSFGISSHSDAAQQLSEMSSSAALRPVLLNSVPASFPSAKKRALRPHLERLWDEQNRIPVLIAGAVMVLAIAWMDWKTVPYMSLGFLYLFPILLAAGFLPRWGVVLLGVACAGLTEMFLTLNRTPSSAYLRVSFETFALGGCGLFAAELHRNRRLNREAEERIRILVETSPAAIVTIDEQGLIEVANQAAVELIAPANGKLIGLPIFTFLPELAHAVRGEDGPQFRASMQCQGYRADHEQFLAEVWFSTYIKGKVHKLAAIIADITDDRASDDPSQELLSVAERPQLNTREAEVLRFLVQGFTNKEIAARMTVSESTVKNTFQQLFIKTSVRTRSQLVRVALEQYRDLL
jgi:PAS domain S-box-containing protein